jgi:arsenate reductase
MTTVSIYHNPRCSKSREALSLLKENGIEPEIIEYLKSPPTASELTQVIQQLGITPRDLLRKGEDAYKDLNLSEPSISDEKLIEAMVNNPKLIERPIVLKDGQARIGRPPVSVLEII